MQLVPRRFLTAVVSLTFALGLFVAPAMAQPSKEEPLPPFDVPGLEPGAAWIPWVLAFVIVAGSIAAALKNPHRQTNERA